MTHNACILVVDAYEPYLNAIGDFLRLNGYNSVLTDSAAKALTFLEEQVFDLVVIDIFMPGIDGIQAISQIRNRLAIATLPIIAIGASMSALDAQRSLQAGANRCLTKPIAILDIVSEIQELLGSSKRTA